VIALVVTTVHPADDPRIRERTVRSLGGEFDVRYAARPPAPSAQGDHEWIPLEGSRPVRWLRALAQMTRGDVAVVSIHDPELIPAGLIARLVRGVPVVVDVHEDVPAAIRHRDWVPRWLRPSLSWFAARLLRLAERFCTVTLAEPGYRRLFRGDHPVFPNYPAGRSMPPPAADEGFVVYVGDVTEARGATDMVDAASRLVPPRTLVLIGRCPGDLASRLRTRAEAAGVDLDLAGWMPHPKAMARAAGASAGLSLLRDLPNYRHSLPTKVVEYLALGIPVVASDLPGTREGVGGLAGVRFVPPQDPAAAGEALGAVVGDAALREELRTRAPGIRERLVWPDDRVRGLYRSVARPGR
jgi:glycosyltransferase involved in cell wall biosynthesis